ncbi:MAG: 4-hydroxy-tetrahydrodipicolinate synthase [Elusimicrobia bacterium RIFOXYC2_FULL_34_12]|nr:MAG: 4-hydroxy-tetrahydrodipicolinate synthase [Elusimicrobia bacterium RIFOXYC2_FULL_34_12]OGS38726.1 MAG: 4-hydroxy-tetrahydrodipicolinate synthase [Elusimicrobia bacterium RIFOXYD2_FULL_34_30]HAM38613.1 4-hydroxy-tetrahydrodipicolinate synthase [Elusimicrobiota bacterium]
MFEGSYVAIVTPFKDNKVDFECLKKLIEFHIKNGINGIVPCGTTGESVTLSYQEHEQVIDFVVKTVAGRIKVIAGTGSNSTTETIEMTAYAKKSGADGVLLVSPYYNKPTQKGLYLHFKKVADEIDIPIMLYNIQSRTAVNIEPETVAKLHSDCKNIVAIKEASGSLEQMTKIQILCPKIDMLSGDDALTLPLMAIGGKGVVSVVANIIPKEVTEMVSAGLKGDLKKAKEIHFKIFDLTKALFLETNPIPIKTAMSLLGLCSDELRLPMCSMENKNKEKLVKVMNDFGLKIK